MLQSGVGMLEAPAVTACHLRQSEVSSSAQHPVASLPSQASMHAHNMYAPGKLQCILPDHTCQARTCDRSGACVQFEFELIEHGMLQLQTGLLL